MKTFITTSSKAATGYELRVQNDDNSVDVTYIEKTYPNEPYTLVLPQNPSNRKYFNSKKVDAAGGTIELTFKESKTFGPRTNNGEPKKKLEDYLTDEEKSILADIMAKAKARREADKPKPLTEVEKAKRAAEKAQAKYEALLAKAQA